MLDAILLRIKRGETPLYRGLRSTAKAVMSSRLPVPRVAVPVLRSLFLLLQGMGHAWRWTKSFFFLEPIFRSRCASVGKDFRMSRMPFVIGHVEIRLGDGVNFFGRVDIFSGRMFDTPRLIVGDRVDIGHNVSFVVNKEIVIEDDVNVAGGVRFMDSDSHPRDAADRVADLPPPLDEIKPVRIGRYAWIGQDSFILKGVTIGEGAVIGANSVVVSDIPEYCVAMGNPARVVVKNLTRVSPALPSVETSENSRPTADA